MCLFSLPVLGMLAHWALSEVVQCVCGRSAWSFRAGCTLPWRHRALPVLSCRIIVGREYYEGSGFEPETVIEMLVTFLLQKKVPRQTEGEG